MSNKILVVDDKQMMRDSVGAILQRAGFAVIAAGDGNTALGHVAKHRPAAVITDLKMPEMDGLELLSRLRAADDQLPVILMTAYGSVDSAVKAMKDGAFDFVQKPFEGDQLVMTIRRAVEHRRLQQENAALRISSRAFDDSPVLVGQAPIMKQLGQTIQQVAHSHGTVLISGESGTGKEIVSRIIHAHSPRREQILLCLNCAALSGSLLESELFGHEKGAFTGADQLRKGRFELADGGTLLLDEISEITPQLQAKLLRVLQENQFERVGSSMTMSVDVRVIATTNRDLSMEVAEGTFRQDLFYRLNVLPIHLPPLRKRVEDVPLLANHFLMQVALREGREPKRIEDAAIELMMRYGWPGNVRELQNICERASVLTRGRVITAAMLAPWLTAPAGEPQAPVQTNDSIQPLEEIERQQIVTALDRFGGNRQRTAEALGIGVRTLGLKLKKWKEANLVAQTV
jgi:DNA-binding NtrC family response regulator